MTREETTERLKMILAEATSHEDAVCYVTANDADALEMAIKALEQEPCEDAISRQAVLSPYESLNDKDTISIWLLRKNIEQQPSVTPQQRWIPVSERLPSERDWYLGIFKESDTGWINPLPYICDYVGSKTKATTKDYWILRNLTDIDAHIDYYFNLECVAWMPLPEPYKVESEEK